MVSKSGDLQFKLLLKIQNQNIRIILNRERKFVKTCISKHIKT